MKVNEIDIFSATMFRHVEKIPHACKATCAHQIRRDLRECNWKDRIDFDLAFLHAIPLTYDDSRTMPYAHATRDTAGTDSVAQILYEQHVASLNAEGENDVSHELMLSAQRHTQSAASRPACQRRRGAAVAATNNCIGRSDLQRA
jgi:hypothetical protein